MNQYFPILEFDPNPSAIINPSGPQMLKELPERGVLCFFKDVLDALVEDGCLKSIGRCKTEMGEHFVYEMQQKKMNLFVFHAPVGAALAAGLLEELIAAGAKKVVACGGCGALRPDIHVGQILIITSAIRDEGTSYHYLAPSPEVQADPSVVHTLQTVCSRMQVPFRLTKAWTTDAYYRETEARRDLRISQGCDVVEMEASAFLAVCQFRQIRFGQILYGGDLVIPEGWDDRGWVARKGIRRLLFDIAVQAALEME